MAETSLPTQAIQEFQSDFLPDVPYESIEQKLQGASYRDRQQVIGAMNDLLYDIKGGKQDREKWEDEKGIKQWKKDTPSWIGNVARGIAGTAAELTAGFLTGTAAVEEAARPYAEKQIEETGFISVPYGIVPVPEKPDANSKEVTEKKESTVRSWSKSLRDWETGHENRVTWEEVKERPAASTLIPFVMEQGLISLPHMVAAVSSLPTYIAARSGQLGHERAMNKALEDATI